MRTAGDPAMSGDFEFTSENRVAADRAIAQYPPGRGQSAVLALLDLAQRQNTEGRCITDAAIDRIAEILDMPRIRVVEVATFFTMINLEPVGRHLVQCCRTTPCWLRGSEAVREALKERLGIHSGETTEDGQFTLIEVECLGACVNAPVVQINDDYYEDLSPVDAVALVDALARGERPQPGSQTGRQTSAPAGGPRVLTGTTATPESAPTESDPTGSDLSGSVMPGTGG